MTKKSDIPQAVLEKAKEDMEFLKEFDYPHAGELQYLGKRNKVEYYVLHNPTWSDGFSYCVFI